MHILTKIGQEKIGKMVKNHRCWWCHGLGGIIMASSLGSLVPIEHCLHATAYLSIVADHVHPFMATLSSSDGYFQQDNAPCHKAHISSET